MFSARTIITIDHEYRIIHYPLYVYNSAAASGIRPRLVVRKCNLVIDLVTSSFCIEFYLGGEFARVDIFTVFLNELK